MNIKSSLSSLAALLPVLAPVMAWAHPGHDPDLLHALTHVDHLLSMPALFCLAAGVLGSAVYTADQVARPLLRALCLGGGVLVCVGLVVVGVAP